MFIKQLEDKRFEVILESEDELINFKNFAYKKKSLKANEVLSILGITRQTLCHYVKRGLIEIDTNYTGGQYRYNAESVYKLKEGK